MPLVLAACLPLWCGCGTEEYEQRMTKTMASYRLKGKFVDLIDTPALIVDPGKNVGVNVTIRIPKAFVGVAPLNEQSPNPNHKITTIPKNRVQPPFMDIPGFQMTYEQLVASSSGQRVMSLYFGVTPADPEIVDKIPGDLKAALKLQDDLTWKNELVVSPDDGRPVWRSITVQGPQGFYWTNQGLSDPETLDGTFSIWVHEEQKHYVFIAYRFPTSSMGFAPVAKGLHEALLFAAGTVRVTPKASPTPPAQP
jgi:hypothetical protein